MGCVRPGAWVAVVLLMIGVSAGRAGAQETAAPDGGIEPEPMPMPMPIEAPPDASAQVVAPGTSLFEAPVAVAPPVPSVASAEESESAPAAPAVELGGYVRGDLFVGK